MQWVVRMRKWLEGAGDRRRSPRNPGDGVVAHYWSGGAPAPRRVCDVSLDGAYVRAPDTWYPGTVITLTFQAGSGGAAGRVAGSPPSNGGPPSLAVRSAVVRSGVDGFAVQFLFVDQHERAGFRHFLERAAAEAGTAKADGDAPGQHGQALIEFALVLPLLFLLIMNLVNFGAFIFSWITVANAARAGADYMIMGAATVNAPPAPTAGQIAAIVTQDTSSLLNRASLQVRVCKNNQGVITCAGTAPGSPVPSLDPESPLYVSGTVDVTYTFVPPISGWTFPNLGIYLTLPSTTIHRRAVMRIMN